jgi:glycine cleavage system transcriptional repressor
MTFLSSTRRLSSSSNFHRALTNSLRSSISESITRPFTSVVDKEYLVVNAVGLDRPGIVSDITKQVTEAGGNIGSSQASKLGTQFGLMMLVAVPKAQSGALKKTLSSMDGMSTSCFVTSNPDTFTTPQPSIAYSGHIFVSGADHPGIVHRVTDLLAKYNFSIDQMETSYQDAPFGGTTLFIMDGTVTASTPLVKNFSIQKIREELEMLGDSLNCDVSLEDFSFTQENDEAA